tara:strand:- start:3338 stop:3616 length:279 start_codon:yes stop_codon:yes gene_type:complete
VDNSLDNLKLFQNDLKINEFQQIDQIFNIKLNFQLNQWLIKLYLILSISLNISLDCKYVNIVKVLVVRNHRDIDLENNILFIDCIGYLFIKQ